MSLAGGEFVILKLSERLSVIEVEGVALSQSTQECDRDTFGQKNR